jgi:hypothetical protein
VPRFQYVQHILQSDQSESRSQDNGWDLHLQENFCWQRVVHQRPVGDGPYTYVVHLSAQQAVDRFRCIRDNYKLIFLLLGRVGLPHPELQIVQ